MTFSFLAPAVLALTVLVAGPILAHLTRRQPTEMQSFGLMFLLERMKRRVERRRRVHDLLLLLLRVLVLLLVVAAAARPELRLPESAVSFGGTGRVVVLLDNSLSMDQRKDADSLLSLARADAAATLRALPDGVQVALITAGGVPALVSGLNLDHELTAALVEEQPQTSLGTDLRGAFQIARELLGETPGEILVYTDEAGPGNLERCAEDLAWLQERGSAILPRIFAPAVRRNIVPIAAEYGDGMEGGTVSVKLLNYGPDPREVAATVALPDGSPITVFLELPGAGEQPGVAEGRITVPRQVAGGVATLSIEDPDLPLDNHYYFHLPRIGASRVLVVDGEPGSTPTTSEVYFLERALAPFRGAGVAVDVVAPSGISTLDPQKHRVAFVANVGDPGLVAGALVNFVREGGGLFLSMGRNISPARYNSTLGSILPAELLPAERLLSSDDFPGARLALPDSSQPLFRPFERSGIEGFGRIRLWTAMGLAPYNDSSTVTTLLRTTGGQPALVSIQVGSGRVVLWTSSIDRDWSNLPLQSIYVPFIQRLTSWMGGDVGGAVDRSTGEAGSLLRIPVRRATEAEVTGPDGHFQEVSRELDALSFTPAQPGPYALVAAGGPPLAWAAVNVPQAETDVRSSTSLQQAQLASLPDRLQRKISLTPYLLAAALPLILGAALLGGRRVA